MTINYIEKGHHLHAEIRRQGHRLEQKDGVFISDDDVAVQSIIDSFDPLPEAKADKIEELKAEAAKRASLIYPHFGTNPRDVESQMAMAIDQYNTIKSNAREALSGNLLDIKNLRDVFITTRDQVNAQTDWNAVMAYDVVNAPTWP